MRHLELVPRYAIALLSVTLAFVLRWAIEPVTEQAFGPFLFFAGAVTVSAWFGGLLPGLVALALATITAIVSFMPPTGQFWVQGTGSFAPVLAFLFEGLIICMVCQLLHQAKARAERSSAEAQEALRARRSSEARFRRLAESDVIGVVEGQDETIVEANEAFLRMLGYPRKRLSDGGITVAEITPEAYQPLDEHHFAELFRVGTLSPFEKQYLTADGRPVPVLVGGALVEPGGSDWVAFVLDLSRQKAVERKLAEATTRAEAASRAKSEFLAVLSHELITPMNAILGMNQLAMASETDPTVRDYLATAQESAEALLALLSDLLDYSSIEAGGVELDSAPFRLRAMLDRVIRPLADRASRKGLELTTEVLDTVPDALIGDARRLRQVLVNLLDNAIKFTQQGGVTLTVGQEAAEANGVEDEPRVRLWFEVTDTGIGIAQEDRDRIYSPFTQIDASNTRPYSGTGLGLSICRQIVGLMGGEITLRSEQGQGSRFRVLVPFRREGGKESALPTDLPDLEGMPILVVDDHASSRAVAESILDGLAMRPATASDGPAALALLAEAEARGAPFPLVLVDAQMPGLDGLAVASRIRREGLARAMILMVSPADRPSILADRQGLSGVEAILEKPITPSRLLDAVVTALGDAPQEEPEPGPFELGPAPARPLHILLAEDTLANQKLALALLRRRGHRVDLAANGREAVDLASRYHYDLILMDLQMPVMDGFQATAAIRAIDGNGKSDVPIIALTAHTMRADRQRCLQAGMDDYLAKPIHVPTFINRVESYGPRSDGRADPGDDAHLHLDRPAALPRSAPTAGSDTPPIDREQEQLVDHHAAEAEMPLYDRSAALQRLGGDEELFRDMVNFFLDDSPGLLDQLCKGLLTDDARAVERAAHSLKGLAATCGAGPAVQAAARVEQIGRDDRLSDAPEAVEHLVSELQRLREVLAADLSRPPA